ncbi:MAG: type II secretion system protein GspK [Kiritimatiellia bacterium]
MKNAGVTGFRDAGRRSSSVVILAVWVLFFLAALAVAVGAYVSANLALAERNRYSAKARCLAAAGAEQAFFILMTDTNAWDGPGEAWNSDIEDGLWSVSIGAGGFSVVSGGEESFGLSDEESRINLNSAGRPLLEALLVRVGDLDPLTAGETASAVMDWRDRNQDVLTGGAENEYYQNLRPPYECRDGAIGCIEELLLIKGINEEVAARIGPHVTLYGRGKININTAGREALECLAVSHCRGETDVALAVVERIVDFREAGGQFTEPSIPSVMAALHGFEPLEPEERGVLAAMMADAEIRSSCFRGTSTGWVERAGGKGSGEIQAGYRIAFVFDRENDTVLDWRER